MKKSEMRELILDAKENSGMKFFHNITWKMVN